MSLKQFAILLNRFALFIIYFWFGLLKVIGQSPASPMVHKLFNITVSQVIPFLPFSSFMILFGLFEMIVGILFFIPKMEKVALSLFAFHMFTTILPLFCMTEVWQHVLVPTLEGQYIVKNIALIACAFSIYISINIIKDTPDKIKTSPLTFS